MLWAPLGSAPRFEKQARSELVLQRVQTAMEFTIYRYETTWWILVLGLVKVSFF